MTEIVNYILLRSVTNTFDQVLTGYGMNARISFFKFIIVNVFVVIIVVCAIDIVTAFVVVIVGVRPEFSNGAGKKFSW